MKDALTAKSKLLAYILRHRPEEFDITLSKDGYANVEDIISKTDIGLNELNEIVKTDSKGRYQFSSDGKQVRAVQGHSNKNVDVGLTEMIPPQYLYHGTATRFLKLIKENGLKSMSRKYVHLSDTYETAIEVGKRHGKPVVMKVNATELHNRGYRFL